MRNTGKITLGIVITILILMLSGALGIKLNSLIDSLPSGFTNQLVIFLFSSILIFIFNKKGIIDFNIKKISLNQVITPILIIVTFLTIVELIFQQLFGSSNEHTGNIPTLSITEQFFTIIIFASISEELLFRGFLQNMLAPIKTYKINLFKIKLSLPVIISGILFGLIHFALMNFGASFPYTLTIVLSAIVLGMVAGYFQEKNENFIFAPIVHMAANLTGMILSIVI